MTEVERHATTRVRHELKTRPLTVASVQSLTPRMLRIVVTGDALADFVSDGFDDHVKLIFQPPGQPLKMGDGDRPPMRDFTPRAHDNAARTLTLDFALHQQGIATEWAEAAKVGDTLTVGGPRGSMVIPDDFDGYLMIGDESALPAIARRLEELRPEAKVVVIATVAGPDEQIPLRSETNLSVHWVHRPLDRGNDPTPVLDALVGVALPDGDVHVWIAGENTVAKAARRHLVEDRGLNPAWMKAASYWKQGEADAHEKIT